MLKKLLLVPDVVKLCVALSAAPVKLIPNKKNRIHQINVDFLIVKILIIKIEINKITLILRH